MEDIGRDFGVDVTVLPDQTVVFRNKLIENVKVLTTGRDHGIITPCAHVGASVMSTIINGSAGDSKGNLLTNTRGVIFYGTPHRGSPLAVEYAGWVDVD